MGAELREDKGDQLESRKEVEDSRKALIQVRGAYFCVLYISCICFRTVLDDLKYAL